ncbi:hypothetical protein BGX34_001434 [Mortierella sp. NVP85]|nr:hypothetical protein BGX34_001434 [Mortierella sp. NVP85]
MVVISQSTNSQAFRLRSAESSEIIHIPTRFDSNSSQHVVRWKDIQQYFKHAEGLMIGSDAVLFLTDDDLEDLIPLRIAHHPGVIIEVVVDGSSSGDQNNAGDDGKEAPSAKIGNPESCPPLNNVDDGKERDHGSVTKNVDDRDGVQAFEHGMTPDLSSTIKDLAILDITNTNDPSSSSQLVANNSSQITLVPTPSAHLATTTATYNTQYNTYFQAIMAGQVQQTSVIKDSMDEHFDRLQQEVDKNHTLQERIFQLQQQMEANQQEMQQQQQQSKLEILQKQQELLELQKQALGRLAVIQNRVQTLLIQTYELHEYPIPRLFIILPKPKPKGLEKLTTNPLVEQFRLYFLCECGTHTMEEGCTTPHEVHLAKHEGYDLDRPKEFFEKYGSYLLTMMYMIKYGIMAAGVVVPPLASSKIVDELESARKHVEYLTRGIGPLVDDTIQFLQTLKSDGEVIAHLHHPNFDKLEVLEGADLRQLETYLKVKDEGRVLGNLFRVITPEGHVKWVCIDHYRTNYRESTTRLLQEIVEVNHGQFIEETGKVIILLESSTVAKQFYDVMVKARGIQELEITLKWDATMEELKALANAVTNANITLVKIDGRFFRGTASRLDAWNRNRRYEPLLQLAMNGRIQSLQLVQFENFFAHVDKASFSTKAPRLRVFTLETEISSMRGLSDSFITTILDTFPSLTQLDLQLDRRFQVDVVIQEILYRLGRLERLSLNCGRFSIQVLVSKGAIQSASMRFQHVAELCPGERDFAEKGYLDQLEVERTPTSNEENLLRTLLTRNPNLKRVAIGCVADRCLAMMELVVSARKAILQDGQDDDQGGQTGKTLAACTLEVMQEKLVPLVLGERPIREDNITTVLTFRADSTSFIIHSTTIALHPDSCDEVGVRDVFKFIELHGDSIQALWTGSAFSNRYAQTLDQLTERYGSSLRILHLNTLRLAKHGFESMARVVERSGELEKFDFCLEGTCMISPGVDAILSPLLETTFRPGLDLLVQCGNKVTGLKLLRLELGAWLMGIAKVVPTRDMLPNLESFEMTSQVGLGAPQTALQGDIVPWIVNMVSKPSSRLDETSMQGTSSSQEISGGWRPLKKITLKGIQFATPSDWKYIIRAIDFDALQDLNLGYSNFANLEVLVAVMDPFVHFGFAHESDSQSPPLPLQVLNLLQTGVAMTPSIRQRIQSRAPNVYIVARDVAPFSPK